MTTPTTVKTIAARLGISHATVSRALNTHTRHLVAEETREKIMKIAQESRYRPSGIARSLRDRRTYSLGFYSGVGYHVEDAFTMSVVAELQNACDVRGQNLVLFGSRQDRSADTVYESLIGSRVDGLVLHTEVGDPLATRLAATTLPSVAVFDAPPGVPFVSGADADGMRELLCWLRGRGHRRIAFVAPPLHLPSVARRLQTYESLCEAWAMVRDVLTVPVMDFAAPLNLTQNRAADSRPTAFCCFNDMFAHGLIRALRETGRRVPEDVAVTGFDGFSVEQRTGELSTICVPLGAIAGAACDLLLRKITGDSVPTETVLPVTLQTGTTA